MMIIFLFAIFIGGPLFLIALALFIHGMGLFYDWAHKGTVSMEDEIRGLDELYARAKFKEETGRDLFEISQRQETTKA